MCRFLVALTVLLASCAHGPRDELVGRWQSDRAATMAELESHATIAEDQKKLLDEILGVLVVEYDRGDVTLTMDEWRESGSYEVIAEGPNYVDLRGYDAVTQEWVVRRVWVEGDRMWIWVDGIGFHEYFRRVSR